MGIHHSFYLFLPLPASSYFCLFRLVGFQKRKTRIATGLRMLLSAVWVPVLTSSQWKCSKVKTGRKGHLKFAMQKTTSWLRGIEACRSLQHLAPSWHINSCESWEHLWLLALQQAHPQHLVEPWPWQNMNFGRYWKTVDNIQCCWNIVEAGC